MTSMAPGAQSLSQRVPRMVTRLGGYHHVGTELWFPLLDGKFWKVL